MLLQYFLTMSLESLLQYLYSLINKNLFLYFGTTLEGLFTIFSEKYLCYTMDGHYNNALQKKVLFDKFTISKGEYLWLTKIYRK